MYNKSIALSLVAIAAFASMFAIQSNVANADVQNGGYTIGPLFAIGEGDLPTAQAEADAAMADIIMGIINGLEPNESFGSATILSITQDPGDLPGEVIYTIEFEVFIQTNRPGR